MKLDEMPRPKQRRHDREVTNTKDILDIIDECEVMRLGLADGLYPYIVPVNFAYQYKDGELFLYLHGASAGRKYELLRKNKCCTFEMDTHGDFLFFPEKKDVSFAYQCVMGRADVTFLETVAEKKAAFDEIIMARRADTAHFPYNEAALTRVSVARLAVTEISAKANSPSHPTAD